MADLIPNIPNLPVASSEHDWKMMSDQDRARLIAAWSGFWFQPTPCVNGVSGIEFARIVLEPTVTDENSSLADWKGAPTAAELKSANDWNKF